MKYSFKKFNPVIVGCLVAVIVIIVGLMVWHHKNPNQTSVSLPPIQNVVQTQPNMPASFDKNQYSLSDPTSLWIVVNKLRPLNPVNYVPPDLTVPNVPLNGSGGEERMHLRKDAASALESMFGGASQQGLRLMLVSGYRSYSYQTQLYNGYVAQYGQAGADQQSARPGYSEHQTGWAADLAPASGNCSIEQCFADTPEGKWLAANAYKYGFIIRYTTAKQPITGYENEPWHVRYIGTALSSEMHNQNVLTLEEFFDLAAAPDYQ